MRSRPLVRLVFKTLFVVLLLYFTARFVTLTAKMKAEEKRNEALRQQVAEQYQQNALLEDIANNGVDEDYIVQKAREYGYVLPDEKIYEDVYAVQ